MPDAHADQHARDAIDVTAQDAAGSELDGPGVGGAPPVRRDHGGWMAAWPRSIMMIGVDGAKSRQGGRCRSRGPQGTELPVASLMDLGWRQIAAIDAALAAGEIDESGWYVGYSPSVSGSRNCATS
jgi:hypothetical protein